MIELASQTATDADGEARFANLEAGIYYVAVSGKPWYAQTGMTSQDSGLQPRNAKDLDVAYPITLF